MKSNSNKRRVPSQNSWFREMHYRELELEIKFGLPEKEHLEEYFKLKSDREKLIY